MKKLLPTLLMAVFAFAHLPSSAQEKKTNAEPAKAATMAKDDAAKKDEAKAEPKVGAKKGAAKDEKKKPKRGGC